MCKLRIDGNSNDYETEDDILLSVKRKRRKHTFSIDIFEFLNTIRKTNDLCWTDKGAEKSIDSNLFILSSKLTSPMDRKEERDICLYNQLN